MQLFIMSPLGLGDSIIVNGLVRCLSKEFEKVYFPCWSHNLPSVKFMFSDEPKILVQEVVTPNDIFIMQVQHEANGVKVLKLGCYAGEPEIKPETFDQTFYRQAGVAFSERWNSFKIPEVADIPRSESLINSIFICDDSSRGFNIDDLKVNPELAKFRPWRAQRIFEFIPLLQKVNEIHSIDSSWLHLVESIPTKAKLFYHLYPRNAGDYHQAKKRKNWNLVT